MKILAYIPSAQSQANTYTETEYTAERSECLLCVCVCARAALSVWDLSCMKMIYCCIIIALYSVDLWCFEHSTIEPPTISVRPMPSECHCDGSTQYPVLSLLLRRPCLHLKFNSHCMLMHSFCVFVINQYVAKFVPESGARPTRNWIIYLRRRTKYGRTGGRELMFAQIARARSRICECQIQTD